MRQFVKYQSGVIFCLSLTACVVVSLWLSQWIPTAYFDNVVTPILVVCTTTVALVGAWLMFRHSDGLRIRKAWGSTLVVWALADGAYLVCWVAAPLSVMNMGAYQLTTHELLIGNLLGWTLLVYPTEALRPQWLNGKRALLQLVPMIALVALDYILPVNLAPVIALYPFVLLGLLITHVRAYKIWCEENFSTLDNFDVQWIMRYLIMLMLVGCMYLYLCLSHSHTRGFTQLWLVIIMLAYSTEKILFQRDPWKMVLHTDLTDSQESSEVQGVTGESESAKFRAALEQWMEAGKPYCNPDFRLIDLQQVLPMNRTYLSQFIHREYDCTFYQFVNRYRIEEAQRLKMKQPDIKLAEMSVRCGFSSPTVFTRTFTAIVGVTPRQWAKKIHSA
ncbi:MAG: helix-turn-helix transcriptional regulator [Prevotella sp.]|nr:helix-turn-helix transcriptional regulator [Prevotella sp.]